MWKYLLIGIALIITAMIIVSKITTSRRYNIYKKYKRMINFYKELFPENLSNELVFQYISDIDELPKIDNNDYIEIFTRYYNIINNDNRISDDLKFQLKVSLNLKGIHV